MTPSYEGVFTPGEYEFGPATGIVPSNWIASNNYSDEKIQTQSGSFEDITVADDTNYWITLQVDCSKGTVPYTNFGKASTKTPAISKHTLSRTSSLTSITGYRKSFWGVLNNKNELTSSVIRSLSTKEYALANGSSFEIDIPESTESNPVYRVVIAYPSNLRELTMVLDENDSNTNIVSGFD